MDEENKNQGSDPEQNQEEERVEENTQDDMENKPSPELEENQKKPVEKGLIFAVLLIVVIIILGLKFWSHDKDVKEKAIVSDSKKSSDASIIVKDTPPPAHKADDHQYANVNRTKIEQIIQEYIKQHPEVIIDAFRDYEQKMIQEKMQQSKNFIDNNMQKLINGRPFLGNPSGSKLIVKFFDYQCGYCKHNHLVMQRIVNEDKDVKVVLENVPVLGTSSALAAKASVAMWKINPMAFDKFHNDLMNTTEINEKVIENLAKKYRVSKDKLFKEMDSNDAQQAINDNMQLAHQLGIQGVPAFIVNGHFIPGSISYEDLKNAMAKKPEQNHHHDSANGNGNGNTTNNDNTKELDGKQLLPNVPPLPTADKAN